MTPHDRLEEIAKFAHQDWVKNPAGPSDTYILVNDIIWLLAEVKRLRDAFDVKGDNYGRQDRHRGI